nr:hypothetical protein [Tanacetum cinerariifolium]
MTSFGYRLNPRYAIKECLSCGALYTRECSCSKGSVEDKVLVPKPPKNYARCANCGHPVNGHYCQRCALVREKLEEDLVTYFQNFQNISESSDDSTNIVNAPREPFVVKHDHGVKFSQNPPHIDKCCCECGEALDGIYCQQCICKSCGKGAHIGYNCPPKVLIISNSEPCNQTMNNELHKLCQVLVQFLASNSQYGHYCAPQVQFNNHEPGYSQDLNFPQNIHDFQQQGPHETFQCQPVNYCEPNASYDSYYSGFDQFFDFHPQQYPCCENCEGPHETFQCQPTNEDYYHEQNSCYNSTSFGFNHCQPPQYTINHPIFDAHNDLLNSQNELSTSQNTIMEQMIQLTSMCEMVCQIVQKKQEEKWIEEEQSASARYWKILACCDDDDDYDSAITPVLSTEDPVNSLSMGDEHLDTIPAMESDKVIKSSVEDLVSIPSESEGENGCDVPSCFATFSNILFDADYDFKSVDD